MKSVRKCLSEITNKSWPMMAMLVLLANGCGKGESPSAPVGSPATIDDVVDGQDGIDDADKAPLPGPGLGAPAWGTAAERRVWANAVMSVVRSRIHDLEKARDKETFCPGYSSANAAQRANCWLLVVAAITKFESGFKPASMFREPDGKYSVGMLAMSPGECPNAPSLRHLQSAVPNLVCGTNKMASLIARYGNIDGPASNRGASRYWSTLRAPYKRWDPTRNRYLNLGKRNQILPLVRGFRGHKGLSAVMDPVSSIYRQDESDLELGIDGYGYHDENEAFDVLE